MNTAPIFSPYGGFSEGDHVSRDGTDIQLVKDMTGDGFAATFVCVVAPASGWCQIGEEERNVCRRYERMTQNPETGEWIHNPGERHPNWMDMSAEQLAEASNRAAKAMTDLVHALSGKYAWRLLRLLVINPSNIHRRRFHRQPKRRSLRK